MMPSPKRAKTGTKTGTQRAALRKTAPAMSGTLTPVMSLARQVKGWADSVLAMAGPATDLAAMQLTRSSNPQLWKALEQLGVGRLVLQAGRERELANIYRANDAARRLADDDFAAVLGFTRAAFDMGVGFRRPAAARRNP